MSPAHRIELLGSVFRIHTDENQDHMQRVLQIMKSSIAEVENLVQTEDKLKTAILAGMIIADEVLRLREATKDLPDRAEFDEAGRIAQRLIRRIHETIGDEASGD